MTSTSAGAARPKGSGGATEIPPNGTVTDVSCDRCRKRRVKCNRSFPKCSNCTTRKEACSLVKWRPAQGVVLVVESPAQPPAKRKKPPLSASLPALPEKTRVERDYESDASTPERDHRKETSSITNEVVNSTVPPRQQSPHQRPNTSPLEAPASSIHDLAHHLASSSSIHALSRPPVVPLPTLASVLQHRQPREALCKTLVAGETALAHLTSPVFDLTTLAAQLSSNCLTLPESSCIVFPSPTWSIAESNLFPTREIANQALSDYFEYLEPTLRLFPTNQSRDFLFDGFKQWWNVGSCTGGIEWQALYLATTSASAIVSTDDGFTERARGWIQLASRMVFDVLRFASIPTLNGLRTLLLVLHTALLGTSTSLYLPETLAYLPIFVSAAFQLELNFDPTDLTPAAPSDEIEERRNLWWQIVKLQVIWSTLLDSSHPTIDLSSSSTRLPFSLLPPSLGVVSAIDITSWSSTETVLRLLSRLLRLTHRSVLSLSLPEELDLLSMELSKCERELVLRGEVTIWKAMVRYALLRLQSLGEETSGTPFLSEVNWSTHTESLLNLVSEITPASMVDRLPILLFVLQGATIVAVRLSTQIANSSTMAQLHTLNQTLRTTPWPAYMHQFVKRGVIVVENLTSQLSLQTAASRPPDPSLSFSSPQSSRSTL